MKEDVTSKNMANSDSGRGQIRKREPLTGAEKRLIVACVLFVAVVGSLLIAWEAMNQNPIVTVPTPASISPNARDFYVKAGDQIVDQRFSDRHRKPNPQLGGQQINNLPKTPPSPLSLAEKDVVLAKDAVALRTMRQGFAYPYAEVPDRSFQQNYPHYARIYDLAELLKFTAEVKAAHGDWGGSVNGTLDAIRMGNDIPHGGAVTSLGFGTAVQHIGRVPVWQTIGYLNARQARAAVKRLEGILAKEVPYVQTVQESKWATQACIMDFFMRKDWRSRLCANYAGDPPNRLKLRILMINKRVTMHIYSRYMDACIAQAKLPYDPHRTPPIPPNDPLAAVYQPFPTSFQLWVLGNDTANGQLLIMLALQAYKQEHGSYPTALTALTPSYLTRLPDDPFAPSGTFRYRLKGKSYLLYSVGADGKDDGGTPIQKKPTTPPHLTKEYTPIGGKGDIVAGVNTF